METVERYIWIVFILITSITVITAAKQLRLSSTSTGRALFIANLPWLLIAFGLVIYPDRSIFELFDLRLALAYGIIGSVILIWAALLFWLFWRDGAEALASSPNTVRALNLPRTASGIKLFAIATTAGGVLGLVAMLLIAMNQPG